MQKQVAELLMSEIIKINSSINDVLVRMQSIESDEDMKALSRGLVSTGLHLYREAIRPIIRQFPELDPDASYLDTK